MQKKFSRRQMLSNVVLGLLVIPVQRSEAVAEKLSINDLKALELGYVENAAHVDAKRFPNYKSGQTCANCMLIQMRYGFFRPCSAFPNKIVNAKGWCSAWAAKTYSN